MRTLNEALAEKDKAVRELQDTLFLAVWPLMRPWLKWQRRTLKPRWQRLVDEHATRADTSQR